MLRMFLALAVWATQAAAQSVTAVLEPAQLADIRSTVAGRITEIAVSEGDRVAIGTVLVQMDSAVQQARVALAKQAAGARGQLQRAAATVDQAEAFATRVRQARARGAAQAWEVTAAEQAVLIAEAEFVIAQEAQSNAAGQLAMEEATLAEFGLRAPFDGTVLEIFKEPGEIIDTQEVVITFGHLRTLQATAFVPVEGFGTLEPGKTLRAIVDDGRRATEQIVTVDVVDPRIDPASQTVRVTMTLPNGDLSIAPGATLVLAAD